MTTTTDAATAQVKPFAAILQEIGKGALHAQLSDNLNELVRAVAETEKPGSLTLTIKVEPTKGMDTLTVSGNCTVKRPTEQSASIFFADGAGNLTRNDPRQSELPLRGLDSGRTATA
jgi:hypothetical protein